MATASENYLHEAFTKRNTPHGGVPVGAVVVGAGDSDKFISVLQKCLGNNKIKFRARNWISDLKVIVLHLPVEAAIAIESNQNKELQEIMSTKGIGYYPGVRPFDPLLVKKIELSAPASKSRILDRDISEHATKKTKTHMDESLFTFAELFAGIGGFRLGLEPLGGHCVVTSEIDSAAIQTYRANFSSDNMEIGDISDYYDENLPDFDILTGGFPCQPFSTRGEQQGMLDLEKGQLFLELVRLLKNKRPKSFLFENVVGLILMDGGRRSSRDVAREFTEFLPGKTFTYILKQFEECGYIVSWRVVNSRHWLPQFRERVYIVGFRSDLENLKPFNWHALHGVSTMDEKQVDLEIAQNFPQTTSTSTTDHPISSTTTVRDILQTESECSYLEECELTDQQWLHVQNAVEKLTKQRQLKAATTTTAENDSKSAEQLERPNKTEAENLRSIPIDSKMPCLVSGYHRATSLTTKFLFEEKNGMKRTGTADNEKRPRFLTPRECARLMGFPDSFIIPNELTEQGRGGFYKQIGNAVCPPVIEAIGQQILISLGLKSNTSC